MVVLLLQHSMEPKNNIRGKRKSSYRITVYDHSLGAN